MFKKHERGKICRFPTKRNYFAKTLFNVFGNAVKLKTGKKSFTFPPFSQNLKK